MKVKKFYIARYSEYLNKWTRLKVVESFDWGHVEWHLGHYFVMDKGDIYRVSDSDCEKRYYANGQQVELPEMEPRS